MAKKSITITPHDTPWEVACMLINATHEHDNLFAQKVVSPFFGQEELRRIGEHLISYCNAERDASE